MQSKWKALAGVVILVFLAGPAFPARSHETVLNGIDVWHTPARGGSFAEFTQEPIPADFFCNGSEPFTGRIFWQGEPLTTEPVGALGLADTVIHRLEDAVFDANGRASIPIQVKALSLVSTSPLVTSCGSFDVRAHLWGDQQVTEMHLQSLGDGKGYFQAPLALTVRLVFTPVDHPKALPLEITGRHIEFPARRILWTNWVECGTRFVSGRVGGFVVVDTDGDNLPDLSLPGTSNFFPKKVEDGESIEICENPNCPECLCHCTPSAGMHCIEP